MSAAHPDRDAIGLALAYGDGDDGRLASILEPYTLDGGSLHLLVAVLDLVGRERDALEGLALAGAGLRPDG